MKQKTVIWDDHNPITGTHEQAKSIITNGSKLIMQFKTGQVSIESPTIQKYTITDKDNKYALDFQFTKQGSQTIILKNPSQWIFRNTEHKAHFYSPYVMKYFDLDNPDITISKITKMSDGFYIDIVTKDAVLKTNSIGDLNVVTNYTYFTILERPDLNTALLTDINQSLANLNANVDDLITETRRGSNMYLLIFLPALLGLFAIIGATTLGREHTPLKIALFLFSFISVLGSAWLGTSIIGDLDSNVQDTLGQFVFYGGIIIVILFSYFMLYFVYKFFQAAAQSKDDKLEY